MGWRWPVHAMAAEVSDAEKERQRRETEYVEAAIAETTEETLRLLAGKKGKEILKKEASRQKSLRKVGAQWLGSFGLERPRARHRCSLVAGPDQTQSAGAFSWVSTPFSHLSTCCPRVSH